MTTATFLQHLVRQLRHTTEGGPSHRSSDAELLQRFQHHRDPHALDAIVRRYGSCVLSACRKVLTAEADVEDAFQATFVVLLQQGNSIRQGQALGGWLSCVAHRVALRALTNTLRRQRAEQQQQAPTSEAPDLSWREASAILHEELDKLPDQYRRPLILCYLDGKSRDEAAQQLGVTTDALRGRLDRGRERLRRRLLKRGIALSGVTLLSAMASSVTARGLPEHSLRATLTAATTGQLPASVAALLHGATPSLTVGKCKLLAVVVLTLGLISGGVGLCLIGATSQPVQPPLRAPSRLATATVGAVAQRQEDVKADETAKDEETKKVEVSGSVLTPDGKPCAGAKLFVSRPKKPVMSKADFAVEQVGTSGTDGRFHITFQVPAKRVFSGLIAHAAGFGVNWVEVRTDKPVGDVTVKLVKDQSISGRILDTEGKPVAGVTVGISLIAVPENEKLDDYLAQWKTNWRDAHQSQKKWLYVPDAIIGTTTTDDKGKFKLAGAGAERIAKVVIQGRGMVPAMPYVLTRPGFDPKSYNEATLAQVPVYEREWREMPILSGPDADFVVQAGKRVEGVVRDRASGKPLAGVRVSTSLWVNFELGEQAVVTDVNGKYRLEGLPQQQKYSVYAVPPEGSSYLRRSAGAETTPGIAPVRIDVELVKGIVVSGRVIDWQTGKGVEANVRVVPLPDNKHCRQPKFAHTDFSTRSTDREGRFRLVTIPGKSLLFAEIPLRINSDGDTIARTEWRELDEELCPYTAAHPDPEYKRLFQYDETWGYWRLTSALGEDVVRFHALQVIDLKDDVGEVKVELPVERGRALKVLVQDADGKPLTGVRAGGVTANFQTWCRLKDESTVTVYALDPTQPRRLTFLHLEKNLGATATVRGDEKEAVVVKLVPLGAATGRFVDAEGRPLAGIEVSVGFRESIPGYPYPTLSTKTDRDGRFTLPSILPGRKFRLQMMRNFMGYASEPRIGLQEVASGKTLDLGERKLKPEN